MFCFECDESVVESFFYAKTWYGEVDVVLVGKEEVYCVSLVDVDGVWLEAFSCVAVFCL